MNKSDRTAFLPVSKEDMAVRGIEQLDFVYISGDAYVDHPSFGTAIISRILEANGFTVGIIAQPNWRDPESVCTLGEPKLGFLISAGNMDSMVNHYSVAKKRRRSDFFSPGGKMGLRPDYAVIVYSNLIRRTFKKTPIIIGGIEASLRRLAHYDYWSDKMKRSVLLDSGADIISYGMGERSIVEIAEALRSGIPVQELTFIRGTVYKTHIAPDGDDVLHLPGFDKISTSKELYAKSFYNQYLNTDPFTAKTLVEPYPDDHLFVVQNPPQMPLSTEEMDDTYALPYTRTYHPDYEALGGIPAIEEVKFSLASCRGCFGACSFCALTFHEGRVVQTRSHESILAEARQMVQEKEFKGYIHDVGGPTADFRGPACKKQLTKGACPNRNCLFPEPCKNMVADHRDYVKLLRELKDIPGVKKVFIRSGIRFDYVLADKDQTFLSELVKDHVSGQLRVAPEHVSNRVLSYMGKPRHEVYQEFIRRFDACNKKTGKQQYALPYFMSSHPGCDLEDAVELAEYIRDMGFIPEQAQDFYPTPSTLSTCMYYTGLDPRTMDPVYVPKSPHEKAMQRALIQYRNPENYELVCEALRRTHREDLIGFGPKCLVRPRKMAGEAGKPSRGKGSNGKGFGQKTANDRSGQGKAKTGGRPKKTLRNVHKKK